VWHPTIDPDKSVGHPPPVRSERRQLQPVSPDGHHSVRVLQRFHCFMLLIHRLFTGAINALFFLYTHMRGFRRMFFYCVRRYIWNNNGQRKWRNWQEEYIPREYAHYVECRHVFTATIWFNNLSYSRCRPNDVCRRCIEHTLFYYASASFAFEVFFMSDLTLLLSYYTCRSQLSKLVAAVFLLASSCWGGVFPGWCWLFRMPCHR